MATHEHESEEEASFPAEPTLGFVPPIGGEIVENVNTEEQNFPIPVQESSISDGEVNFPQSDFQPESAQEFQQSHDETPYDFSQTLDHSIMSDSVSENVNTMDSADFSDVTEFANSTSLSSPLSYTVIIDGIESSHLIAQIKEAMTDSRFAWEVSNILAQVGGGRLVLPGLSPAKASVLINRIKYLPLKISWRQDVLSST